MRLADLPTPALILDLDRSKAHASKGASAPSLAGVLTHAGHSYAARSLDAIREIAEIERHAVVDAAERLRRAGLVVPCVGLRSTRALYRISSGAWWRHPGARTVG